MKNVNYTPELTAQIVDQYQQGVDVEAIAAAIDKSVRSVRSKLVREGVYIAKPKVTTRKANEPTKKELLNQLGRCRAVSGRWLHGCNQGGDS